MKTRYLVLENGAVFPGQALGADAPALGELVFTTGMCGYLETLTDPSYYGQLVVQTFPLIGNYGVITPDLEGDCALSGYIVRECCDAPSNFRAEGTLDAFLKQRGIPGLCGVDTRQLTRIIRQGGVTNALLCDSVPDDLAALRAFRVTGAVAAVTPREKRLLPPVGEARYSVALLDYGAKKSIAEQLCQRGCAVTVYPADTPAEALLAAGHHGLMLSNGPGDPAETVYAIRQLQALAGKLPIFGICLGHQLLALALGGRTEKMKFGHRGVNQPVRDLLGRRTYITSQNHGYAVAADSLPTGVLRYQNANDGSCEGMDYPDLNAFSVQFHPEAGAGPQDTRFLFDEFLMRMERGRHAAG